MKKQIFTVLLALSLTGLAISLGVHIATYAGYKFSNSSPVWQLHIGAIALGIPVILQMSAYNKVVRPQEMWKAALAGAPRWMPRALVVLMLYTFVNLFASLIIGFRELENMPLYALRSFSGAWILFYSGISSLYYSWVKMSGEMKVPTCPNGHTVSFSAKFCEECGEKT